MAASPSRAPTSQPVAAADATGAGRLPLAGAPQAEGSAQAVAIVLLGIPALLIMTLLATVLTRR